MTPPTPAVPENSGAWLDAARSMLPSTPPDGVQWLEISVPNRNGAPRLVDLSSFRRAWQQLTVSATPTPAKTIAKAKASPNNKSPPSAVPGAAVNSSDAQAGTTVAAARSVGTPLQSPC